MKKKLLFALALVSLLVCLLSLSISAETVLNPQNGNAYGQLSTFDESIAVGRTDSDNGFTPYLADGVSYARVVIGDGTTFYTFPTYYMLSKNNYESNAPLFQFNFTSLNSAMETATGTNPGWTKANVYRIELPTSIKYISGDGTQKFESFTNMIELTLAPDMTTSADNKNCLFRYCPNLEVINNIDTFVFRSGCLTDAFYNNAKLTSLTLCYSPAVKFSGTNVFRGCSSLTYVNFTDAFPSITDIGNHCFNGCTSLKSISASTMDEGIFNIQSGVTSLGEYSFANCKAVKYVSIPNTLTYLGAASFHTCSALEFVEFNNNQNDVNFNNWGHFMDCVSLKAMSLPQNTDVVTNRMFSGCKNLQALCLPSATVTIESNGYGNGSSFSYCNKVYFVNEPFAVTQNGEFYGDSFVQPEKPEIYYMPNNLTNIFQRDSGVGFAQCYNLNSVIVFPENLTQFWINDGVFYDCGAKGNKITVVFLGDMTNVRIGMRENRAKGISYVFANPSDTDLSQVNVIDTSPNYSPNLNGDEFVAFCVSGKYFNLRNLGGANDDAQYTEDNVTYVTDESGNFVPKHIVEASTLTEADCITNTYTVKVCFCGATVESVENEGTALGHEFDLTKGAKTHSCYYLNYFEIGIHEIECARCAEINEASIDALFAYNGYSVTETPVNGKYAMTQGFTLNRAAYESYTSYTGKAVEFGVVAAANTNTDGSAVTPLFYQDGNIVANGNAYYTSCSQYSQNIFNIKIVGITEDLFDARVVFCMYIIDGDTLSCLSDNQTLTSVNGKTFNEAA